jgi:hypothetical protein
MATLKFTFDFRHAGALLAQIEGRALIGCDGIDEIFLEDMETEEFVTISGDLEAKVRNFLEADEFYAERIRELTEEECAGRVTYDREVARHAAE